jgi:hypothetical protein
MTEVPSNNHGHGDDGAEGGAKDDGKHYWLDDMRNVHKLFWALVVLCILLFLSDAFYEKHVVFEFEHWFGFFGLFGFTLSFALVLTARELRKILMREEEYYDR